MDENLASLLAAEGSFAIYDWGVAWWSEASQQWILDSSPQPSKLMAENYKTFLLSLDPEIDHRVVRVTRETSFKEVE